MKNRKCFYGIIAIVAVCLFTACASGPREVPEEFLVEIRDIEVLPDEFGLAGNPNFGRTIAPDGQEAFFVENGKNRLRGSDERWLITGLFIRPGNFRGFTRMSVDIAADNADLINDFYRFIARVRGPAFDFRDFNRNNEWAMFKRVAAQNPTQFHTFEWDIEDPSGRGNPDFSRVDDIWLLFIGSAEEIPGRIYFRNLRFLR